MDPVTHVVLGASLGYAVFGRRLGRAAAGAGGLAAFVPDADIFLHSAQDPLFAIEHHRGFTHALAFSPVGAAVVAALWLLRPGWRERPRWLALWACCTLGYLSHTLLDAATTYGTQLLWPFSTLRASWDLISIIDPLFTLVLMAGLAWSLRRQAPRHATVALGLAGLYLALGSVQHTRAVAAQDALARKRGHAIERREVMPTMANNVVWRALYQHQGRIYSDRIRVGWFSRPTLREGWSLPRIEAEDLMPLEKARDRRRSFVRFAWFSEHWVARSPADPTLLADMRYTLSAEAFDPIWGIRFTTGSETADVAWVNRSRERRVAPAELWREIRGNDPRFRAIGE